GMREVLLRDSRVEPLAPASLLCFEYGLVVLSQQWMEVIEAPVLVGSQDRQIAKPTEDGYQLLFRQLDQRRRKWKSMLGAEDLGEPGGINRGAEHAENY